MSDLVHADPLPAEQQNGQLTAVQDALNCGVGFSRTLADGSVEHIPLADVYQTPDELKPCPFCGPGRSIVEVWQDPYKSWRVTCGACGGSSGHLPEGERWPNARQLVIDNWNRRASPNDDGKAE